MLQNKILVCKRGKVRSADYKEILERLTINPILEVVKVAATGETSTGESGPKISVSWEECDRMELPSY